MNKYVKVKVEFIEAKDRLNRLLWIKDGISLNLLAHIILTTMHSTFSHSFGFDDRQNDISYGQEIEDFENIEHINMNKVSIRTVNKNLILTYDYGDNWTFDVKITNETRNIDSQEPGILIDGKGQGIWEDYISSLYAYLNGEVNPNDTKNHYDKCIGLPYNFKNKCYGDFDKPLNIEKENKYLSKHIKIKF